MLIDLGKRMNQVLALDDESCFALLEPGVTYFGLYEAIRDQGKKLWVDVPDLGGGSVLGNTLDRGVGYTPYGDHFGMHCGTSLSPVRLNPADVFVQVWKSFYPMVKS